MPAPVSHSITTRRLFALSATCCFLFVLGIVAFLTRITQTIDSFDGEVSKVENLGVKEFQRTTVPGFVSAPYVQIDFNSGINGPPTLKEQLRLDKSINRVVITSNN